MSKRNKAQFSSRVRRLSRRHRQMASGYRTTLRADGLIVVAPHRRRTGLPLGWIVGIAVGFICFKAFMWASLGPQTYLDRLAILQSGTWVEQAGAFVMQAGPWTQYVADVMLRAGL